MTTTAESHGHLTIAAVDGTLDEGSVPQFQRVLSERIDAGANWFILDFSRTHHIDSKGLEAILWLLDSVEPTSGKVRAAELNKKMRKIFELTRFEHKLKLFDSIHEAVSSSG